MALTYFNTAAVPADNGTNTGDTVTFTPPANMVAGDVCIVVIASRYANLGFGEQVVVTSGGQTWHMLDYNQGTTALSVRMFLCRYNGTWAANPVFTGTVATCVSGKMTVVHSDDASKYIDLDVGQANGDYTATGTTKTASAVTTRTNGAFVYAVWFCTAARTWSNLTAGWATCGSAYYRNTSGSDLCISDAYLVKATAGSTGTVSNDQNIGTIGTWLTIALCEQTIPAGAVPTVDVYIPFESSTDGTTLTAAILNTMTLPASPGGSWTLTGAMTHTKVATAGEKSPGKSLTCSGTTYDDTGSTRGLSYNHELEADADKFQFAFTSGHAKVSEGFLVKIGQPYEDYRGCSMLPIFSVSSHFTCFNFVAQFPARHASQFETDTGTNVGPDLVNGTWYWVTLLWDGTAGLAKMAIYLPDSGWAQHGFTLTRAVTAENATYTEAIVSGGTPENRAAAGLTYIDDVIYDWTTAAFPLLPGAAGGASSNFIFNRRMVAWFTHLRR